MYIIFFAISFLASIAGAICGIGGGVIIKPVLDASGLMEVGAVSFLSGCTVLAMSAVSVGRSLKNSDKLIELRTGTALAVGGALGGTAGKDMFQYVYDYFPDSGFTGALQAGVLLVVTLLTLVYTLYRGNKKTFQVKNIFLCGLTGLALGIMSSFLGIGGGPINLMVLTFLFSMTAKQAAANSLYIILFSQAASFINAMVKGTVPQFPAEALILMIVGGVLGALMGGKINKRISDDQVNRLFAVLMAVIIVINIYNIYSFLQ